MRTTIPGAYETVAGNWTVPLSLESCLLLRQKFGGRLIADSELRRWTRGVQQSRRQMASLASQNRARLDNLPRLAPRLYKAMRRRSYQLVGARFVADSDPGCLLADEPGLGKTLIALGGILEAEIPGPYLIIAPKTAADATWKREIERWLPREHRVITMPQYRLQRERKLRLSTMGPKTWIVIHPDMAMMQAYIVCKECGKRYVYQGRKMRTLPCKHAVTQKCKRETTPSYKRLFEIDWGVIVTDESHESLIVRSSSKLTQRRRGIAALPLRGDGKRIAISGTPFDSKPHQLWGTLNWLDAKTYSAFYRWAELYWRKGGYTGFQLGEFIHERERMLWDSLSAISLRRTKAEVATDLPPKLHVGTRLHPHVTDSPLGIWLDMDGEQARAYEEMERLSIARLDSGRLDAMSSLAELTRLKQLACSYGDIREKKKRDANGDYYLDHVYYPKLPSNKLQWIIDSLEEWGYPSEPITKVVIVSFYTGILECFASAIETHFKTKPDRPLCTAISGRTKQADRRPIIDRFNTTDGPQIMMLNVKAGGTSITIDSVDRMIFISETRIPDQQLQAEDRIHRVSNPRHCMYYYLRSLGTVDVGTAIENRQSIMDSHRLLDGRRGVKYFQRILDLSGT